ncbi:hypothetical protein [Microbacter margulisiae]|uniref:Uncharacterized protein n=1 Tax=Microbacter margulisiae TaxID=1350067 RepID=A0A7W5DSJ5_9PORP|nr:hypothetical protein [Microbacter margulisiae]MBB3188287.1 hypothetical protein [Microbacter margulisiae]
MESNTTYVINHLPSIKLRIWKGAQIFVLQFILIFVLMHKEFIYGWIVYFLIIAFTVWQLISKRSRQVVSVSIDYNKEELLIQYNQLLRTKTIRLPFESFNYTYAHELYDRIHTPMTLVFYDKRKLVAQIMHKYSGWSDDRIKSICETLLLIKDPVNDKRLFGGRLKK